MSAEKKPPKKIIPPPKNVTRKIIYLPNALLGRVEAYQQQTGMALTQLVRQCLDDHLRSRGA